MLKASPSLLPGDQRWGGGAISPCPLRGMGTVRVGVGGWEWERCWGEQGPGAQGPVPSPARVAQSARSFQTSDELKRRPLLFHPSLCHRKDQTVNPKVQGGSLFEQLLKKHRYHFWAPCWPLREGCGCPRVLWTLINLWCHVDFQSWSSLASLRTSNPGLDRRGCLIACGWQGLEVMSGPVTFPPRVVPPGMLLRAWNPGPSLHFQSFSWVSEAWAGLMSSVRLGLSLFPIYAVLGTWNMWKLEISCNYGE